MLPYVLLDGDKLCFFFKAYNLLPGVDISKKSLEYIPWSLNLGSCSSEMCVSVNSAYVKHQIYMMN